MAFKFLRQAKVYVQHAGATTTNWEVPVLSGFSFSQSINTTEIPINQAGATPRRDRFMFNDSLAPVEWSMSTYVNPQQVSTAVRMDEEVLWAMLLGADEFTSGTGVWENKNAVDFNTVSTDSNAFTLAASEIPYLSDKFNIFVDFDGTVYKLDKAAVSSATVNFDLEGIATIEWSGNAATVTTSTAPTPITNNTWTAQNFIRNRLTALTLLDTNNSNTPYNFNITGGSISFDNNLNYITPDLLGQVNQPWGNTIGIRTIGGNLTCYLDTGGASGNLYDLLAQDTTTVTQKFDLTLEIGGTAANGLPTLEFNMPAAHLEIPALNVEDIITLDVAFHALRDSTAGDELSITYGI